MKILFIGGDKRMNYAADSMSAAFDVSRLGMGDFPEPEGRFDVIVLPLPLTKNGREIYAPLSEKTLDLSIISQFAKENAIVFAGGEFPDTFKCCDKNGYTFVNYFSEEALTLKNAALTAEAACAILSQSTDGALLGSAALITGYGRISRYLARQLAAHGASVIIAARRAEQRTQAELDGFAAVHTDNIGSVIKDVDFIANTVPSALFTAEHFAKVKAGAVFAELATLPDQPSKPLAEGFKIRYVFASGLPGKYSPRAAGEAIADTIRNICNKKD